MRFECGLLSVVLLATGCGSVQVSPIIQPRDSSGDPKLVSERALDEVAAIGACVDDVTSVDPMRGAALRALVDMYVGLGRIPDDIARAEGRTVLTAGRPPLQHYPRLTFPALVEPTVVGDARRWLVPVLLNRVSFRWTPYRGNLAPLSRFSFLPFVHGGSELFRLAWLFGVLDEGTPDDLTYWLEPLGSERVAFEASVLPIDTIVRPQPLPNLDLSVPRDDLVAIVLAIDSSTMGGAAPEGFYNLRLLPRIQGPLPHVCNHQGELFTPARHLDWYALARRPERFLCSDLAGTRENLVWLLERIDDHRIAYFRGYDLDEIEDAVEDGLNALEELDDEGWSALRARCPRGAVWERECEWFQELCIALRAMLHDDLRSVENQVAPAPVLLDAGGDEESEFSFIVAADTQYHGNLSDLRKFLAMIDPGMIERLAELGAASGLPDLAPVESRLSLGDAATLKAIRKAKFVLFAGDLADGAAGSAPLQLAGNYLGLVPPACPYFSSNGGEFQDLRRELRRFGKPFFAVPGNHDGYVGFSGVGNLPFDFLGGNSSSRTRRSETSSLVSTSSSLDSCDFDSRCSMTRTPSSP